MLWPGYRVIDLGAAPGSWSQVAASIVFDDEKSRNGATCPFVLAVDLEEIDPLDNVTFIRGDFTDDSVKADIFARQKMLDTG